MLTKASRDGLGLLLFFVATSHVVNVGLEKMSRCALGIRGSGGIRSWRYHRSVDGQRETALEHKTCIILAVERLRLMIFDNRLIIDSFQKAICILKW